MSLDQDKLKQYREIEIQTLSRREELGNKSFEEVIDTIKELKQMIDEMIEISESVDLPQQLNNQVNQYMQAILNFQKKIKDYNLDNDGKTNFQQRKKIINEIKDYYNQALTGKNGNNFLNVYNTVKNFSSKEIQKERQEISKLKKELNKSKAEVEETLKLLRDKASEKTTSDYAEIYGEQAKKHSALELSKSFPFIKLGAAQYWMIVGSFSILLLGLVIYFLFQSDQLSTTKIISLNGIDGEYEKVQYQISNIIIRLLIVSVCVFLIGFSFKQYSVNRHLFTINKHRQNALDSYPLFIKSIDTDDKQVRHQLIIEVAKAIYEQNTTGYISDKSSGPSSSGLIELTKYINPQ